MKRKAKNTTYKPPIVMTEEFWKNSQFSIARHYGGININGVEYIICDKYGRAMAIEPGEPCDLVIRDWLPLYRQVGRERFLEIVKQTNDLAVAKQMAKEQKQ